MERKMLEVKFYDSVDDSLLKFAVIVSQSNGKWVFCKHKIKRMAEQKWAAVKEILQYQWGVI